MRPPIAIGAFTLNASRDLIEASSDLQIRELLYSVLRGRNEWVTSFLLNARTCGETMKGQKR
jgi:hypothetical protein